MTQYPDTYEVLAEMRSQREGLIIERSAQRRKRKPRTWVVILAWLTLILAANYAQGLYTGINLLDLEGVGPSGWRYEE